MGALYIAGKDSTMHGYRAFTLDGAEPRDGIQGIFKRGRSRFFGMGASHNGRIMPLGLGIRDDLPIYEGDTLIRGSIKSAERRYVGSYSTRGTILIHIVARRLDFEIEPLADNLTFNAGGEGIPAVLQVGRPRDTDEREQLFELARGEHLYVADRRNGIVHIGVDDGRPQVRPATREEVVGFVLAYGLAATNKSGMTWAIYTLRTLDAPDMSVDIVARRASS